MTFVLRHSLATLVGVLLLVPLVHADRYFTWVDDQGQLRTTRIQEADPLRARAEVKTQKRAISEQPVSKRGPNAAHLNESGHGPVVRPSAPVWLTPSQSLADRERTRQGATSSVTNLSSGRASSDEGISIPKKLPEQPVTTTSVGKGRRTPVGSDPVYNLTNFPDGIELEENGYMRKDMANPFFTWTDAGGRIYNTPFNPGKELQVARQNEATMAARLQSSYRKFSRAVTLRQSAGLPSRADPLAAAVLGLKGEGVYGLQGFARSCCRGLEKADIPVLQPGQATSLRVGPDAPVFNFETGLSPYRVVKLPRQEAGGALNLRSFASSGAFFPTLVFLDEDWQPVRMVTDIDFSYEPESWYRYGYLQALVPVQAGKGERWLLVMTTMSASDKRRLYSSGKLGTIIRASRSGELELGLVGPPGKSD